MGDCLAAFSGNRDIAILAINSAACGGLKARLWRLHRFNNFVRIVVECLNKHVKREAPVSNRTNRTNRIALLYIVYRTPSLQARTENRINTI